MQAVRRGVDKEGGRRAVSDPDRVSEVVGRSAGSPSNQITLGWLEPAAQKGGRTSVSTVGGSVSTASGLDASSLLTFWSISAQEGLEQRKRERKKTKVYASNYLDNGNLTKV